MGRPRKSIDRHLDAAALDAAVDDAQRRGEARLVRRLCLIESLYAGDTLSEAADRVGVTQPTASRWANDWNEDGVDGLRPDFGGGRPPELSDRELDRLAAVVRRHGPFSIDRVHRLLEEALDVSYSRRHVRRILDRLEAGDGRSRPGNRAEPGDADRGSGAGFEAAVDELAALSTGDYPPDGATGPGDGDPDDAVGDQTRSD